MIYYIRKWFISGLLVWLPILVTFFVIKFIVDLLAKSLALLPNAFQPEVLLGLNATPFGAFITQVMGVTLTVLVILGTGMFVANYFGRQFLALNDALMSRIPLVRTIYNGVKQVTQTLFTPGGQSFRKVLLVEYPCAGVWSLAFQTGEVNKELESKASQETMVSYFIPTTPNPTSGFLMMAPKSKVIELDMSVDQALKYVISLGVVQPIAPAEINGVRKVE